MNKLNSIVLRGWMPMASVCILICAFVLPVHAELVLLMTLARHGSRSPDSSVVQFCPNNPNIYRYSAPFSELTIRGMHQAWALGRHVRQLYIEQNKFLPARFEELNRNYSGFHSDFWSDSAVRCLQTTVAFGYGLYPREYYGEKFPIVPLPVHSEIKKFDDLFVAAKADCSEIRERDEEDFAQTAGAKILQANVNTVKKVCDLCGFDIMSLEPVERVSAWKDVADFLDSDHEQGFPLMPGMSPELYAEASRLSFELLMQRFYATERQITYWAGQFPERLLNEIRKAVTNDHQGQPVNPKFVSFTSHRELIYAMILMMGWNFKLEGEPSYNYHYQLAPLTTLFWELHRKDGVSVGVNHTIPEDRLSDSYFVRIFVWTPIHGQVSVTTKFCKTEECSLDDFFNSIETHVGKTGAWDEICGVNYGNSKYVRICRELFSTHTNAKTSGSDKIQAAQSRSSHNKLREEDAKSRQSGNRYLVTKHGSSQHQEDARTGKDVNGHDRFRDPWMVNNNPHQREEINDLKWESHKIDAYDWEETQDRLGDSESVHKHAHKSSKPNSKHARAKARKYAEKNKVSARRRMMNIMWMTLTAILVAVLSIWVDRALFRKRQRADGYSEI